MSLGRGLLPAFVALALLCATPTFAQEAREPAPPAQAPRQSPTVVAIEIEGARRYAVDRLRDALGQEVSAPLDRDAIERGVQALWQSFHVRAEVSYREVEGGVVLRLTVVELPSDLEPRFVGNDEIGDDKLREWAQMEDASELFVYQAPRVRQRLLEGYRQEGFYHAEVSIVTRGQSEQSDFADVIFEIREGPKVRVKDIVIRGNDAMRDRGFGFWKDGLSTLSKRELEGRRFLNWFGDPFVEETLDADLLAMREVYRERGFLDAVVEIERLAFNDERDRVVVHVIVDEGEPYRVSKLDLRTYEWTHPERASDSSLTEVEPVIPREELLEALSAQPGAIFEVARRERDRGKLRDRYGKTGRISHASLSREVAWEFLEPELVFDRESHTVAVVYRVVQGKPIRLREIRFSGTSHTRDKVLRRELSVYPGALADLTEIQRSLVRIEGTGFFSDTMRPEEHRPPTFRFRPVEGDATEWDLEFVVEEGQVVDFQITGGVDTNEGVFGLLSLTMRNFDVTDTPSRWWRTIGEVYSKDAFHGGGERVDLEISPGTVLSRYRIHYNHPDIFELYERPISLDLDFQKRVRIYDSHDEDRLEQTFRLRRKLSHEMSVGIGYKFADVEAEDLDTDGVPPALDAQEQDGKLNLQGVLVDAGLRRYDNLLNPRRGYWLRYNTEIFGVAGDAEFIQQDLQFDGYLPMGDVELGAVDAIHLELALSMSDEFAGTSEVPYTERSFLGGNNLRGFDFRGVGPFDPDPDDDQLTNDGPGFALGAETMLYGTLEYQRPLYTVVQPGTYRRIEMLRGTLFCDFGIQDAEPYRLDLGDLRASVGFGVGLAYPLPITLNFGFPIAKEEDDRRQVFSFSIGLR